MLKSMGPRMLSSDTPDSMGKTKEKALKYLVHCDWPQRYELNHFRDVSLKSAVDKAANRYSNGIQSMVSVKSIFVKTE